MIQSYGDTPLTQLSSIFFHSKPRYCKNLLYLCLFTFEIIMQISGKVIKKLKFSSKLNLEHMVDSICPKDTRFAYV